MALDLYKSYPSLRGQRTATGYSGLMFGAVGIFHAVHRFYFIYCGRCRIGGVGLNYSRLAKLPQSSRIWMLSMGDDSLIPISDEQAKLGQELVKAVRDGSGYFTDILGDLPKDLIGLLIGDRVKAKRIERMAALWQKTREHLRDRDIEPEPPSLKYAIPILEAAADEENDELQDLWSRLLAAAMDPTRRDGMRQSFIATVKQMDPMDVLVLKAIHETGATPWEPNRREWVTKKLKCSTEEVIVSFAHLNRLDCISIDEASGARGQREPSLRPFGSLLMKVVSD